MKKLYSFLLIFSIVFLIAEDAFAQRSIGQYRGNIRAFNKNKRYWSVGGSINALNYFGDLAPKNRIASTELSFTRPGIGIMAQYRLSPEFSVRANFMYGRLRGNDNTSDFDGSDAAFRHVRNLHFRNDIKELSAVFVWDIKAHTRTFITRPELIPYVFAGVAVFHHNPQARVPNVDAVHYSPVNPSEIMDNDERYRDGDGESVSPGDWIDLKPLRTEGTSYSNFAFAIPVGAGVRYKVNRYWDLSFEVSYRQTFTDYVDDVSGYYRNPQDFPNTPEGNLARIMAYRSNELDANVITAGDRFVTRDKPWSNPMTAFDPAGSPSGIYTHYAGYGWDEAEAIRGKDDYDVYLVTSISLTYILGTNIRNAKFR